MADQNELIENLRDLSHCADEAADAVESAAGYIDFAAEEESWSVEDRNNTESALDRAHSKLSEPTWPSDLQAQISELKSKVQAIRVEEAA